MELCLFVALLIGLVAPAAAAGTAHIVGGSEGWAIPQDPKIYDNWSANNTFHVGDSLVFKWTSVHTVLQVTSESEYEKCTRTNGELKDKSPATFELTEKGTFYYICSFPSHCQLGQKITIKVEDGNSSSSPPSSATPPTSSPTSTPTSSSSPTSTPTPTSSESASPPSKSSANTSLHIHVFSCFFLFSSFLLHFLTFSS